jgi:dolichol-phosphate mannosyltransferase
MPSADADRNGSKDPRAGLLTIMIPCFNEEGNVELLHERVTRTLTDFGRPYELIFVDDGSTDATYERLRGLFERDSAVRVIRFARNFGQQMAITAALDHARGDAIVLIDADMQTAPEEIPLLVNKLAEGYDIVYGVRQKRKDPLWRIAGSRFVARLMARLTGITTPDSVSAFLAFDGDFVRNVRLYRDKSRVLVGLFAWLSYGRSASVPVSHAARQAGETKYTFSKCVSMTLDFICNHSLAPLRFVLYAGGAVLGIGLLMLLATLLAALVHGPANLGLWALASAIVFCSGAQLLAIGILGEYLGRTFLEVKDRPLYVIRDILEVPQNADA